MADDKTIFDEVKKICPKSYKDDDFSYCVKSLCEWWVTKERCCCMRLIAEDLNHIASHSKLQ